jgi:hypothetical protein
MGKKSFLFKDFDPPGPARSKDCNRLADDCHMAASAGWEIQGSASNVGW